MGIVRAGAISPETGIMDFAACDQTWDSVLAADRHATAGQRGRSALLQPALPNILKLPDYGDYLFLGQFGAGAVAFLVPPPAALRRHSTTLFAAGVSQAACVQVTTNTLESGPQHKLIARVLSQIRSPSSCYCHTTHLPSINVCRVRQRHRPQRVGMLPAAAGSTSPSGFAGRPPLWHSHSY